MIGRFADDQVDILIRVTQVRQDGHETDAALDALLRDLAHGVKALFGRGRQALHLADALGMGGIQRVDDAEQHRHMRDFVDLDQQVQVAQDEGGALEDEDREMQFTAYLKHAA